METASSCNSAEAAAHHFRPPRPRQGDEHVHDSWKRADEFAGLEISIRFADGRSAVVEDLSAPDEEGDLVLSRFWRKGWQQDTLWLWAMPQPVTDHFLGIRGDRRSPQAERLADRCRPRREQLWRHRNRIGIR